MTKIALVGDQHIGSKFFEEKKFKKVLRNSEKIILMGDLIEGITKKDKRHSRNDCIMSVDDEIIYANKILRPYASKIITACIGNHEDTLLSIMDIDAAKLIYAPLGIEYIYTDIIKVDNCSIAVSHGTGATATYGGAISQLEKFAKDYLADFYAIGHTHKLLEITMKKHPNKTFTVVNTGTFLSGAEYADKRKLPPPVVGYIEIDTLTKRATKILL